MCPGGPSLSQFWALPCPNGGRESRRGLEPVGSDQPFFQGPGKPGHLVGRTSRGPPQRDQRPAGMCAPAARPGGAGVSCAGPRGPGPQPSQGSWPAAPWRGWSERVFPAFGAWSVSGTTVPLLTLPTPPIFPGLDPLADSGPPGQRVHIPGENPRDNTGENARSQKPCGWDGEGRCSFKLPGSCFPVFHTHWGLGPTPVGAPFPHRPIGQLAAWVPNKLPRDLAGTTASWQPVLKSPGKARSSASCTRARPCPHTGPGVQAAKVVLSSGPGP